jgi:VIT1/CCC1 family predicted Fe2+/Mn2+ transporter
MSGRSSFWINTIKASGNLSSIDRVNEILFGLIMVLTFTCSISAATGGHEELSTILWSALGCNIAWGFVDSLMYLFSIMLERGEMFTNVRAVHGAATEARAKEVVRSAMSPLVAQIVKEEHLESLTNEIKNLPEPPGRVFLTWRDIRKSIMIFFLVFLSTFPVTLPFLFIEDVKTAMRVSNAIALILLFTAGVYLGRQTGHAQILSGLAFAIIGSVLVFVTMALGG